MKWLLKQMLLLAVTLTASTCAAGLVKAVLLYGTRTPRLYGAGGTQARAPRLRDAPVRIYYQPRPARTDLAVKHGVAGTVKLSMMLKRDGTITDITPVETLPDGLTYWAMEAAKEIKFTPAVVGGQYTDAVQTVEFRFDAATDEAARHAPRLRGLPPSSPLNY